MTNGKRDTCLGSNMVVQKGYLETYKQSIFICLKGGQNLREINYVQKTYYYV